MGTNNMITDFPSLCTLNITRFTAGHTRTRISRRTWSEMSFIRTACRCVNSRTSAMILHRQCSLWSGSVDYRWGVDVSWPFAILNIYPGLNCRVWAPNAVLLCLFALDSEAFCAICVSLWCSVSLLFSALPWATLPATGASKTGNDVHGWIPS